MSKPILVICDVTEVLKAVNKLLKPLGIKIKKSGSYKELGDQRYLTLVGDRKAAHSQDQKDLIRRFVDPEWPE
jgi:hypothetical protein